MPHTAPGTDRGANARRATTVLLSDEEKVKLEKALAEENAERGLDLGLGSKLRELGLLWARGRRERKGKGDQRT